MGIFIKKMFYIMEILKMIFIKIVPFFFVKKVKFIMVYTKEEIVEFGKLAKSLFDFMVKEGYTSMPYPKMIFDCKIQKEKNCIFVKTGYFDPQTNKIKIFMCDNVGKRSFKDALRTCAHEYVHHSQRVNGQIENSNYKGDMVSEDEELMKLEVPAYAFGNIAFRSWTEEMRKKEDKMLKITKEDLKKKKN